MSPLSENEHLARHIKRYFAYVRGRLNNVEALFRDHGARFRGERWIVLSAVLESLSKRWGEMTGARGNGAQRTCAFLCEAGSGDVFSRCSAPSLLRRARVDCPALLEPLERALPFHGPIGLVREWKDDPLHAELVQLPPLVAAAASVNFPKYAPTWEQWTASSRYGEMLYSFMRNAWLHTLGPHPELLTDDGDEVEYLDEPPDYENLSRLAIHTPGYVPLAHELRRPHLPSEPPDFIPEGFHTRKTLRVRFMYLLGVLRSAVDAFEHECESRRFDPVPEDWRS